MKIDIKNKTIKKILLLEEDLKTQRNILELGFQESTEILDNEAENNFLREAYKKLIEIIELDFKGEVLSQNELINFAKKKMPQGANGINKIIRFVNDLERMGILIVSKRKIGISGIGKSIRINYAREVTQKENI